MLRSAKSRARFALAQHCFAQKNSPKLFCPNAQFFHRYVFASHVASWCSAPLRIPPGGPFGHQKPPILPKSTTTGRVPILATRGRSRVHMHNTATRGHSGAYLPKMTTKGQSPAHLPILANRGRSEAHLNRVSSQAYRNWPPWAPWALNDNLCHRGLPEQFTQQSRFK